MGQMPAGTPSCSTVLPGQKGPEPLGQPSTPQSLPPGRNAQLPSSQSSPVTKQEGMLVQKTVWQESLTPAAQSHSRRRVSSAGRGAAQRCQISSLVESSHLTEKGTRHFEKQTPMLEKRKPRQLRVTPLRPAQQTLQGHADPIRRPARPWSHPGSSHLQPCPPGARATPTRRMSRV